MDGMHQIWLMNRLEHAETLTTSHNPYIFSIGEVQQYDRTYCLKMHVTTMLQ